MRTIRTNFDRQESRRDRRYAAPFLTVLMNEQEFTSDNWSLGGFQLTTKMALDLGAVVKGALRIDGSGGFEFTALVVRKDKDAGTLGFQFREMTPQAITRLDRALARRLVAARRR